MCSLQRPAPFVHTRRCRRAGLLCRRRVRRVPGVYTLPSRQCAPMQPSCGNSRRSCCVVMAGGPLARWLRRRRYQPRRWPRVLRRLNLQRDLKRLTETSSDGAGRRRVPAADATIYYRTVQMLCGGGALAIVALHTVYARGRAYTTVQATTTTLNTPCSLELL